MLGNGPGTSQLSISVSEALGAGSKGLQDSPALSVSPGGGTGRRALEARACPGPGTAGSQHPLLLWHGTPSWALAEVCPGPGQESPVPPAGEGAPR